MISNRFVTGVSLLALLILVSPGWSRDMLHSSEVRRAPDQNPTISVSAGFDPIIDWPTFYGVQQTGMINAAFDCFGVFGLNWDLWHYTVQSWPPVRFESPPGHGQEYLLAGAFWIGGIVNGDTLVSTGNDGWSQWGAEYYPPRFRDQGSIMPFEYDTDYSMRAIFSDTMTEGVPYDWWLGRPHIPLKLKIANRSHAWTSDDYQDFILYDVAMTNIGDQLIEDAYVGIYAEADVNLDYVSGGFTDDLAGSLPDQEIAYVIDNDGDPELGAFDPNTSLRKCFAVKLLASSRAVTRENFNWWVSDPVASRDFGPRQKGTPDDPFFDFGTGGLGTPEGDINKYYILSHDEWDYDQIYTAAIEEDDPQWLYPNQDIAAALADGGDTKFLLSWGPFNLAPGEDLRLLLAMISGEDIHVVPSNGTLLPDFPDDFLAGLNFDNLIDRAGLALQKAGQLLDPALPPIGLGLAGQDHNSAIIEWDPWAFDNIAGHDIFLAEIPEEEIPYPGVVPPWIAPEYELYTSIGTENDFTFDKLNPGRVYFASVAHRTSSASGDLSVPVVIDCRNQSSPGIDASVVTFNPDCTSESPQGCQQFPIISWSRPNGVSVDHYNVYRFDDTTTLQDKYYPFYDRGEFADIIPPKDIIVIDGVTYYFYAMDTYAVVEGNVYEFVDTAPLDGACYIITAVDKDGCESRFSDVAHSCAIGGFEKDVLVLTNLPTNWARPDSVRAFFENILEGYTYAIYSVTDTAAKYDCRSDLSACIDWRDLTNYKWLIINEDNWYPFFTEGFETKTACVTNYLVSGGKLIYCGGLEGFIPEIRWEAKWYPLDYDFVQRFFGVDQLFYYGIGFYPYTGWCGSSPDTCFGFSEAEPAIPSLPAVGYDQTRSTFSDVVECWWETETPPSVATFDVNDRGRISHVYRSLYPTTSWVEGDPVGVKTLTAEAETYLFGFSLWYMQPESARELLDAIFRSLTPGEPAKGPADVAPSFTLSQNYPNPFNPSTIITLTLTRPGAVKLRVYNILGQQVKELINVDNMPAGVHTVEWYGDNANGDRVASGVYFYRLEAGDEVATKTMLMLK